MKFEISLAASNFGVNRKGCTAGKLDAIAPVSIHVAARVGPDYAIGRLYAAVRIAAFTQVCATGRPCSRRVTPDIRVPAMVAPVLTALHRRSIVSLSGLREIDMPNRSYRWLLFSLAVIGFAADQASKYGMFNWLYREGRFTGQREVIPGALQFFVQYDPDSQAKCDCARPS